MTRSPQESLFDAGRHAFLDENAPLAARMRPRTLEEYIGQDHILGPGRLLRRAIQADQLSSLIFYGPPGTGKTTLARIIANTTDAAFLTLNAVLAGVKDIREAIKEAKDNLGLYRKRTILFIDEVHRFNKSQQDALLPHVENGTVILIGATTENPYFEVNKALLSRSRVFQLVPLSDEEMVRVARQALDDKERGYGELEVDIADDALSHLVHTANGDARALLNALELAVETTGTNHGAVVIDRAVAEDSIQQKAVLYDKDGDVHYDVISAFIKSLRGSDPDAALYWLARMVYAGEDPRFIFRRMIVSAGEDIGLADPRALGVVMNAAQAYDYVGMPEGRYHLAQACLYLATAPKSNSCMGFFAALEAVQTEKAGEVPDPLKDANRDGEGLGHGKGYLYPHAYRDHWVPQQYLPGGLQGRVFYNPGRLGYEESIAPAVQRRREEQVAALMEENTATGRDDESKNGADHEWLRRAVESGGERLGRLRDLLAARAELKRESTVLIVNDNAGLLTFEAGRRTELGGVTVLCAAEKTAEWLRRRAADLRSLERPSVYCGPPEDAGAVLPQDVRYDAVISLDVMKPRDDVSAAASSLCGILASGGRWIAAENLPFYNQRLLDLLPPGSLETELRQKAAAAENAVYSGHDDPLYRRRMEDITGALRQTGVTVDAELFRDTNARYISAGDIDRWFTPRSEGERPAFVQHLGACLTEPDILTVRRAFTDHLTRTTVEWSSAVAVFKISAD
jgi:putative ATPase